VHHLFKLVAGGDLHRAPINNNNTATPQRVLDIGTGTGVWALEMAETYPTTEIIGTDLSPIQPNWAPPNVRFFIDDAESEWAFGPTEKFDYVHARTVGGGIADWPRFLRQGWHSLKPGGWFEVQEFECWIRSDDGTHEEARNANNFMTLLGQASVKHGRPVNIAKSVRQWMVDAGFDSVTDDIYKVIYGLLYMGVMCSVC
jgi:trans-aconitate methyltransferase